MMHFAIGLGIVAWLIFLWVVAVTLGAYLADWVRTVLP